MESSQELIHRIEVAHGGRYMRYALGFMAGLLLVVGYNLRCFRNMAAPEAMDSAQIARNLAEGNGYSTLFVRPFSMYLLTKKQISRSGLPAAGKWAEYSRMDTHPDLANPPVYPLVLAGLMKVLPFDFHIPGPDEKQKAFWSANGQFWRSQPDFLIAVFNEVMFLVLIALTFAWARTMFDPAVAWISAALLFGADILWRFSVSGLSTMLLLVIFMGLVWCLTLLEQEGREPVPRPARALALAGAIGFLTGLGSLTRYGFGWLIIPVLVFLALFTGARRARFCLIALAVFALMLAPWIIRNQTLSGAPFGIATYAAIDGAGSFPGDRLERSLNPSIDVRLDTLRSKLLTNTREILQNDLFTFAGGWPTAFFLAGLLVGFRHSTVRRMRHFLWGTLALLIVVQALGRTHLSDDSPRINSENLLVLVMPLMLVYGSALFLLLLDQLDLRPPKLRYGAAGLFIVLSCLPLILALLPPRILPVIYPLYQPALIQKSAELLKENESLMSDLPWAVAWYGHRHCFWLTLKAVPDSDDLRPEESFAAIHDFQKYISALYLSPRTIDGRFVTDWYSGGNSGWGFFIMNTFLRLAPPADFPLHELRQASLPDHMFIADTRRWLPLP